MRVLHHARREPAQLVTEAQPGKSADIRYRERRYLIMMGIRVVCFIAAFLAFINHAGWLTAIPAVGAIVIPYFAVVLANGGREPNGGRGFREYAPSLPARYAPPGGDGHPRHPVQSGESGTPDDSDPTGETAQRGTKING